MQVGESDVADEEAVLGKKAGAGVEHVEIKDV